MSDLGFDAGGSGYAKEDRLVNWERDDTHLDTLRLETGSFVDT